MEAREDVRAPLTGDYIPGGNTLMEKLTNLLNACNDEQRRWLQAFIQADKATRAAMLKSADQHALNALQAFSNLSR